MQLNKRTILVVVFTTMFSVAGAKGQTALRYQFKEGSETDYLFENTVNLEWRSTESKNQQIVKTKHTVHYSWSVLKVDGEGNANIHVKVVRAKMHMEAQGEHIDVNIEVDSDKKYNARDRQKLYEGSVQRLAGSELTATVTPAGEWKDIKLTDRANQWLEKFRKDDRDAELNGLPKIKPVEAIISHMKSVCHPFPEDPVSRGYSWAKGLGDFNPHLKVTAHYTCDGATKDFGGALEKISIKLTSAGEPVPPFKSQKVEGGGYILFDTTSGQMIKTSLIHKVVGHQDKLDAQVESTTTIEQKKHRTSR